MPVIAVPAAALLLSLLLFFWHPLWALPPVILIAALLALTVNFFRDPKRRIGPGVVSPADGVLMRAEVTARGAFFSIFMNIHDVHVNRAPWPGRVVEVVRIPGGHLAAYKKGAARNERLRMTIETSLGRMIVTQVVGMVARRIVPYVKAGRELRKGERIGMIRFGSRVDLFVPSEGLLLAVRKGDRVLAGTTTLAELETEDGREDEEEAGGEAEEDEEGAEREERERARREAGGKPREKAGKEAGEKAKRDAGEKAKVKAGTPGGKRKGRPK